MDEMQQGVEENLSKRGKIALVVLALIFLILLVTGILSHDGEIKAKSSGEEPKSTESAFDSTKNHTVDSLGNGAQDFLVNNQDEEQVIISSSKEKNDKDNEEKNQNSSDDDKPPFLQNPHSDQAFAAQLITDDGVANHDPLSVMAKEREKLLKTIAQQRQQMFTQALTSTPTIGMVNNGGHRSGSGQTNANGGAELGNYDPMNGNSIEAEKQRALAEIDRVNARLNNGSLDNGGGSGLGGSGTEVYSSNDIDYDSHASSISSGSPVSYNQMSNNGSWQLNNRLENPVARLVVNAGVVIPAALITGINSDLPGEIIAQVTQNVFDSATGKYLLIPQGTKLIGTYGSSIHFGQERVMIAWQRLIYPDGRTLDLGAMPGADMSGMAGFTDQVNNHWLELWPLLVLPLTAKTRITIIHQNQLQIPCVRRWPHNLAL